jgi:hypothetical protein
MSAAWAARDTDADTLYRRACLHHVLSQHETVSRHKGNTASFSVLKTADRLIQSRRSDEWASMADSITGAANFATRGKNIHATGLKYATLTPYLVF